MLKSSSPVQGISTVTNAWASISPRKSFFGMTFDQFRDAIKPIYDVRAEISETEKRLKGLLAKRRDADAAAMKLTKKIVHAVKADPSEGEDSPLYAAMGYVRESERSVAAKRMKAASSVRDVQVAASSQTPATVPEGRARLHEESRWMMS